MKVEGDLNRNFNEQGIQFWGRGAPRRVIDAYAVNIVLSFIHVLTKLVTY